MWTKTLAGQETAGSYVGFCLFFVNIQIITWNVKHDWTERWHHKTQIIASATNRHTHIHTLISFDSPFLVLMSCYVKSYKLFSTARDPLMWSAALIETNSPHTYTVVFEVSPQTHTAMQLAGNAWRLKNSFCVRKPESCFFFFFFFCHCHSALFFPLLEGNLSVV